MVHGSDQQLNVVVVDAGESFLEIDGDPVGEAGGEPEHPPLASGAGQIAGVKGGDRGWPVDDGYGLAAWESVVERDELAGEVGSGPPRLGGEPVGAGLQAVKAL